VRGVTAGNGSTAKSRPKGESCMNAPLADFCSVRVFGEPSRWKTCCEEKEHQPAILPAPTGLTCRLPLPPHSVMRTLPVLSRTNAIACRPRRHRARADGGPAAAVQAPVQGGSFRGRRAPGEGGRAPATPQADA